jgi:5-hydroxyisourate hydrolase-like protein (transthyretin family)
MSAITTHVLDAVLGKPAPALQFALKSGSDFYGK